MKTPFKKTTGKKQKPLLPESAPYRIGIVVCVLLFIGIAYYLTALHHSDYLLKTQEQSLFMCTSEFFWECMQSAGGLLTYAGCFLTQFFYYPWLGSTLYILLLLGIAFLTGKVFRMPRNFLPLALVPSALLLLSYTQLGYLLFVLQSPGYVFSNPLGVVVVLVVFWGYRQLRGWIKKSVFILLFVLFCYPLFGFYALFTGLLCILYAALALFANEEKGSLFPILITGAALVCVPYLYFVRFYTRMLEEEIYRIALPRFSFGEPELSLWIPFILLFVTMVFFLVFLWIRTAPKRDFLYFACSLAIYGCCLWQVCGSSYEDENFRASTRMDIAASHNDWSEVLQCASDLKGEPTRLVAMHTMLALQKMGTAGDKMFHYPHASRPYESPRPASCLRDLGAKQFYYQYGDLNFAYRWCMEDAVEYGWKVESMKYMAKCALMNREYELAKKYTGALKKTLFHKEWARKYETYAQQPEQMEQDPEFKAIGLWTGFNDVLDGDGGMIDFYLANNFAMMEGGSLELVELSLQYNLIQKNLERFWPRLLLYANYHDRIPVHYQEAALLFSHLGGGTDLGRLKLDASIVQRFREFGKASSQNAPKGEAYCKAVFRPVYGDTFWYYYFFVKEPGTT